jgi:hypothetical protein
MNGPLMSGVASERASPGAVARVQERFRRTIGLAAPFFEGNAAAIA